MDDRVTALPPKHAPLKVGDTWELSEETFMRWWSMLHEDDRQEFTYLHGGDVVLARFVCALDFLVIQRVQAEEKDLIQLAYWIAASHFEPTLTQDHPDLRARSVRAWKEDAVQSLLDRVRYRAVRSHSNRIQTKLVKLVDLMLEEAMSPEIPIKEKRFAAECAIRFVEQVDYEENRVRSERTKRGVENARKAMTAGDNDLSPRELEAFMKTAAKKLGPEKTRALLGEQ